MKKKATVVKVFKVYDGWASILVDDGQKTFVASGAISNPCKNAEISMEGDFIVHKTYGKQFKVKSSVLKMDSEDAVLSYLSSGYIKGIGTRKALAIVTKFGKDTEDIILNHPKRLVEVSGITERMVEAIHDSYSESIQRKSIIEIFEGKITNLMADKIFKCYGTNSMQQLQKDPYQLIYDVDGIGFSKADELAIKLHIAADDPRRIQAALYYILTTVSIEGHAFLVTEALSEQAKKLIPDITDEQLADAIENGQKQNKITVEFGDNNVCRIYTTPMYKCECNIAKRLINLIKYGCSIMDNNKFSPRKINDIIKNMEAKNGYEYESKQKDAIAAALKNQVTVITGGPGTGKTTITQAIVSAYGKDEVILAAPTGKAAQRMSEVTGCNAQTVHMLVYGNSKCNYSKAKLMLVDEASMLDLSLANALLNYATDETRYKKPLKIVFIGDIYQLPPIGVGTFFTDLVRSPCIPTVTLELSYRQHGKIAINARKVNLGEGTHAFLYDDTFKLFEVEKEEAKDTIVNEYIQLVAKYGIREVCCVSPIRQAARNRYTSAEVLNEAIREKVNPAINDETFSVKGFRRGDRVMQIKNDYSKGVCNGDCGIVTIIDSDDNTMYVQLDNNKTASYSTVEAAEMLVLAYAMSIHKSQGSEYKAVIVVQNWSDYIMLERNLLYTAMTRAKEQVVIVGQARAVDQSVRTIKSLLRNTQLKDRISKEASK